MSSSAALPLESANIVCATPIRVLSVLLEHQPLFRYEFTCYHFYFWFWWPYFEIRRKSLSLAP